MGHTITEFEIGGREFRFHLPDADDHIQRTIRETHAFYELEMLADMMLRVAPGDLVLDCGANIGNHAVFLAGAADATVIALEPFKHCFDILGRNVALNNLEDRVLPLNTACGAQHAKGTVVCGGQDNLGQTRIVTPPTGLGAEVAIIPLNALELTAPVKLIKIDVEGMEADVLRGASEILENDGPVIYAEAHNDEALAEISMTIKPYGYVPAVRFNATPTYRFEKQNQ